MAVTFRWYDIATQYIGNATYTQNAAAVPISIASQPVTVILVTSGYAFSAAHTVYGNITNELTTGGGYTNGGQALTGITFVQAAPLSNFNSTGALWTASGGGIAAFRMAIFYINATVNGVVKPLIFGLDNGIDVPATTAPNTLAVNPTSPAWFQVVHQP